jgi:hypothetical protein
MQATLQPTTVSKHPLNGGDQLQSDESLVSLAARALIALLIEPVANNWSACEGVAGR